MTTKTTTRSHKSATFAAVLVISATVAVAVHPSTAFVVPGVVTSKAWILRSTTPEAEGSDVSAAAASATPEAPPKKKAFVVAKRKAKAVKDVPTAAAAESEEKQAAIDVAATPVTTETATASTSSNNIDNKDSVVPQDSPVVSSDKTKLTITLQNEWKAGEAAFFTELEVQHSSSGDDGNDEDAKTSEHCIIVSKELLDDIVAYGGEALSPDVVTAGTVGAACLRLLMEAGISLENTEGMIDSSRFPVNYFSASQVRHYVDNYIADLVRILQREEGRQLTAADKEHLLP